MEINFLVGRASVVNGSKHVNISGANGAFISAACALFIAGAPTPVEAIEGTGTSIKLAESWPYDDATDAVFVAFNTLEGLANLTRRLRDLVNKSFGISTSFEQVLISVDPTVNIDLGEGQSLTVVPYGYLANQTQQLINSLQEASDLFDELQSDVALLTAAVASQQSIVDDNLSASRAARAGAEAAESRTLISEAAAASSATDAKNHADNSAIDATRSETANTSAQGAATNAANSESAANNSATDAASSAATARASELAAGDSAQSADADATRAEAAASTAESHATSATASANSAENNRLQTQDARDIALANANFAGAWASQMGSKAPPYSVRHQPAGESDSIWMLNQPIADITLSEPAAANSDWFIIGIISGSVVNRVNGRTGDITLTATDVGLPNADNTSDLDKPVSTAAQAALNLKADYSAVVRLTGSQTVAGTKTFSTIPVLPASNPVSANQAVRKGYVDSGVTEINNQIQRVKVLALAGL